MTAVELTTAPDLPAAFRQALEGFATIEIRPEVRVTEHPAPTRLAPYAVALSATASLAGDDLADGRLVVLHDPDGQDVWEGDTRCVAFVQADVDPEIASDPLLPGVGWSWLVEALDSAAATFSAAGGTVTRTTSERFGALTDHPVSCELEIRASWSPHGDLAPHLTAFAELLCAAAGLPPIPPGVVAMPSRGGSRRRR